jgi:hypothetical protein
VEPYVREDASIELAQEHEITLRKAAGDELGIGRIYSANGRRLPPRCRDAPSSREGRETPGAANEARRIARARRAPWATNASP